MRLLQRFPALRALPARWIGLGVRPEHISTAPRWPEKEPPVQAQRLGVEARAGACHNPLMAAKKRSPSKRSRKTAGHQHGARRKPAKRAVRVDPGAAFCAAVESALKRGEPQAISDVSLRRVLTAAVRVYAAKAEDVGREIAPFLDNAVTATETVTAACAMIRAVDLNLFDVAMWFRRPVAGEE